MKKILSHAFKPALRTDRLRVRKKVRFNQTCLSGEPVIILNKSHLKRESVQPLCENTSLPRKICRANISKDVSIRNSPKVSGGEMVPQIIFMCKTIALLFAICSFLSVEAVPASRHGSVKTDAQHIKIDSLLSALSKSKGQTTKDITNKIAILYALSNEYRTPDPDKAIKYGKRGLILSEQLGIRDLIGSGLNNIGIVYRLKYEYHKAIQYHLKALMIYKSSNSQIAVGWSLVEIGNDYYWQNNYSNGIKYYQKAWIVFEKSDYKHGIAVCLNNLGMIYEIQGDYVKAIEYYLHASNKYEELENQGGIAWSFELIANIYLHQDDNCSAMKYYLMSLKIYEELNDKNGIALSYNNIGLVFNNQKKYSEALESFFKASNIFEQLGVELKIAITSTYIGNTYAKMEELQQAFKYQKKALGIQEVIADKNGIVHSLNGIGNVCNKSGKSTEAIKYLQRSITLAKELGMKTALKDAYKYLSTAYAQVNDYEKAHDYYQKYAGLNDVLYDEKTTERIAKMQVKYEAGKKEREIELLSKENELQALELIKNRYKVYTFSGGFILVLILALVIVRAYRQKQKINEQLEKKVGERTLELSRSNKALKAEINERKEVVNALLESEGKFRALVESTTAVTLIIQDDKFAYVNPAMQKLIGYSPDELYCIYPWDLIHPDHQKEMEKRGKQRLKGKKVPDQYETVMVTKKGKSIRLDVAACLINYKDKPAILATCFDITERKKAEEQLILSDIILKNIENYVLAANEKGEITYASQSIYNKLGYSKEEVLGKNWFNIARPDLKDRKTKIKYVKKAAKGEINIPDPYETAMYDVKGNTHWILWQDARVQGNMLIGIGTDISDRRITENALRNSESKYRTVIEQSLEAIYLFDPKTKKIIEANEAFLKYTSYTEKEIKKLTIYDFVAHDKKNINAHIKSILKDKSRDIGQRVWRRKNGKLIDVLVSASTISRGKNDIIFVTARDITEQKQVEEQLRKSEQKHRMLIETMKDGVIQVNQDDTIQFINEQFCKMIGYAEQELLGKNAANLFLKGTDKVFMGEFKSLRDKGSSAQNIVQLRKKDGKFIRVLISGSTNYGKRKKIIGSTGVITDITKILEYEENLDKINHELNTFIYKASHDLKGPLSSSVGIVNMCKENINDMNILSNLDLISSSLDKLDRILQDLTQITLIRQGKLKILPIKVKPLLEDIVQTFSHHPDFGKTDVIIEHNLRRPLVSDAEILGIILRNLFENALKYRKIGAENSFIKIKIASKSKMVIITITDNGIGIPKKYHNSIYNMFVRASTISWGSGLGLYSVKNAVEKLNGTIKLKSKENKGTTFTLYLPDLNK